MAQVTVKETIPTLSDYLKTWIRYVDDTLAFVKIGHYEHALKQLNSFDRKKIRFTYESSRENSINLLDTTITWNNGRFETTVYRKKTNTDLYIHWQADAPKTWKRSTLRGLVKRAYNICSNEDLLKQELHHLRKTFHEINGYPNWVIDNIISEVKNKQGQDITQKNGQDNDLTSVFMTLPYTGDKGVRLVQKLKRASNKFLPQNADLDGATFAYNYRMQHT
ncbi:hypothetical protein AC249_AIPGENE9575 [Exaiptasia diaphana]|nr:hypothetical protein AC249_AIPGENE9575 [Exaiptasia diaphana]